MAIETTGLMRQQLMQSPTNIAPQTPMDGTVTRTSMARDLISAMNDIDFRQLVEQYAAISGQSVATSRPLTNQMMQNQNNNLAIDFDGVIHTFDKGYYDGTCYGAPIKGVYEALENLSKKYNLIIFTAKIKKDRPLVNGKTGLELVQEWLIKHNLNQFISEITCEKPRACYYIDDKAIEFKSWETTLNKINA